MSCCPPGSAPYLAPDHNDEGRIAEIDGVSFYQVGTGEAGLLILPDVWGWNGGRTRAIADDFAKRGLSVWVPKLLAAYQGGTHDDGLPPAFNIGERMGEVGPLLGGDWNASKQMPKMLKVVGAMKKAGVKRIGVLGFCYGAWIGMHLAKEIDLVCGASPHPSIHVEGMMGGDPGALAAHSRCPWALFPCGALGGEGSDPDMYDTTGAVYKALEGRHAGKNVTKRFSSMAHGFVTRGAIKADEFNAGTGDEVKVAVQSCVDDITEFFVARGLLPRSRL